MWLFFPDCAVSIVAHRDRPGDVLVRGRLRGDVERFVDGLADTWEDQAADYCWRAIVSRSTLAAILSSRAFDMEYDNVKAAIPPGDHGRQRWYGACWAAGLREQHAELAAWAVERDAELAPGPIVSFPPPGRG